jgi:hypothetical protein
VYAQKQLDLLKMDITKWTKIEINNIKTISLNKDMKGHKQLLFELINQYTNSERYTNSSLFVDYIFI